MGLGEQYELEIFGRIFPENYEPKGKKMLPTSTEGRGTKVESLTGSSQKQYNFFWSGPYSQWDPSPFQLGEIKFSCAEQMMMLFKALVFDDLDVAKAVMATDDPQLQKAQGRKVKRFLAPIWDRVNYSVVYIANVEKFSQNPEHLKYILTDGSDMIVEASPEDKIWGIGIGGNHPDIRDESKWQGENRLGKVCMDVRNYLRMPDKYRSEYNGHYDIVVNILIEKAELLEQLYK